ncbi:FHA domain-containing protein [uncultured Roseovarius sp.]|uniref:FHA domain-containing protein n=1 Tax=uncultured Roseovarius sp. TaxID=293344 RepID=UPI00260A5E03|nr:FHA domain-containing protein [uncultured Roseovarius sp.]
MSNDKTKWIFDETQGGKSPENTVRPSDLTETLDTDGFDDKTFVGGDEPTVQLDGPAKPASDKTEIFTRGNANQFEAKSGFDADSDPVTGWLVVVKGPGLGHAVSLGTGMNIVGRGSSARCSLPFGDNLISSEDHIRIIYDEDDRKFFIAHGSGKNVSRVNGQILMNTMSLEDDAVVELSKVTKVMFKAFCGSGFDWSDLDKASAASESSDNSQA